MTRYVGHLVNNKESVIMETNFKIVFAFFFFLSFETRSVYAAQTGLEFTTLLHPPLQMCWDYRCVLPYMTSRQQFHIKSRRTSTMEIIVALCIQFIDNSWSMIL